MKQSSFDNYAHQYDHHFTHSEIGKMQRDRVKGFFQRYVKNKKKILEINCGTGEDAVWLASTGHQVLATDASGEMIRMASKKKKIRNIENLEFLQCAFRELKQLQKNKYDLIFSNFGGLNCISKNELYDLSELFSSLLEKNGRLVLVIMGRKCSWERFYFNRKKELEKAVRRMNVAGIKTVIGGNAVHTWYYSPKEIIEAFKNHFSPVKTKPVGLFIPPSYLNNYFSKKKISLNILNFLEKIFGEISGLSDHADHYFIILEKTK